MPIQQTSDTQSTKILDPKLKTTDGLGKVLWRVIALVMILGLIAYNALTSNRTKTHTTASQNAVPISRSLTITKNPSPQIPLWDRQKRILYTMNYIVRNDWDVAYVVSINGGVGKPGGWEKRIPAGRDRPRGWVAPGQNGVITNAVIWIDPSSPVDSARLDYTLIP